MASLGVLVFAGILIFVLLLKRRLSRSVPLPPGPPADPLIGHLRVMPSERQELVFYEWGQKYGDVIQLRCLGQSIIILNSAKAAIDLLEKRSSNYSDRPALPIQELMGWVAIVGFLPYGNRFRKHRRIFHSYFTPQACHAFRPIQSLNTKFLLKGLLENKGDYDWLMSRFSTAVVMRIAYGHQVLSDDDEYIQMANDIGLALASTGPPGGTPVDLLPFLRYFPSWFPGTFYANIARSWKWAIDKLYDTPFETVKKQLANGTAEPSLLASLLESAGTGDIANKEDMEDIKGAAVTVYIAGADTTWATLTIFLLSMLLFPDCQKLAQDEIDRVIGSDRLPEFTDYDQLPYVRSLVQEVLRWHPPLAQGLPHRSMEDDIYNGMLIPKGSIMIANAMGMALDENVYKNPTQFDPTRFLPTPEGNGEPPFEAAFGFGRRICPGRHLASASLWISISSILATLNILRPLDQNGKEILPEVDFIVGIARRPKPFACNIQARSDKARQLILQGTF